MLKLTFPFLGCDTKLWLANVLEKRAVTNRRLTPQIYSTQQQDIKNPMF